jgi:indoleamine 2,3-dioxygenase
MSKRIHEHFDMKRGFLPAKDPLGRLPQDFDAWEDIAHELPKLLVTDQLRKRIENLPSFDCAQLKSGRERERAMVLLSYLGHAYVWGSTKPIGRLPASLAVPWYLVAKSLSRPPVLSYSSYALHNWQKIDPEGPVALGNIVLQQNFLGGIDEEWFILIHVDIEQKAAPALASLLLAKKAMKSQDNSTLVSQLETIIASLEKMCATLDRMVENCDPYIYYSRVRPYIHGWKDNPGLPYGLVYEGVEEYHDVPQKFRGETGAQSGIIPSLDGALGIRHEDDPLRIYLKEMREYMPPEHLAFLEKVERETSIREYIKKNHTSYPALRETYNQCVQLVERFRTTHLEYAGRYIQKQSQQSQANPTEVGTGGTPFMIYLKKHKEETAKHFI